MIVKIIGICSIALVALLVTTQPAALPPPFLVLPFLLLLLLLFLLIFLLFEKGKRASSARNIRLAFLLASAAIILLALQSLGQLSWRDAVTVLVLFGVAYMYMSRTVKVE